MPTDELDEELLRQLPLALVISARLNLEIESAWRRLLNLMRKCEKMVEKLNFISANNIEMNMEGVL